MKPIFFMLLALLAAMLTGFPGGVSPARAAGETAEAAKPGAPDFGPNVLIFDPATSMSAIQGRLDEVFKKQERNQFGPERYALLFKPGRYDLDVQVGFYTQVAGLGQSPDDVAITGAVRSKARWMRGNATCNFWRAVENLSVTPTLAEDERVNVWAVSQATALRRVHVKGNMNLSDHGWSSGGFIADSLIDGQIDSGTQQQWLSRNARFGTWVGGSWNMVFVGVENPPVGGWPEKPYTTVEQTPVIREKPYLTVDKNGHYGVVVPELKRGGSRGVSWAGGKPAEGAGQGAVMPIEAFYLARPEKDTAPSLNAALDAGKNLILTPGIYHLDDALKVTRPGTVVLGLGYATLKPVKGTPAVTVADVDGVKLGGLLLDAGETNSKVLLQVGKPGGKRASHAADPIFLYDLFCRVGGAGDGRAENMVEINSNDVVGDNFWLWRADHGRGAGWESNPNKNGLIVNGDGVTIYGLFVEHCQQYQTIWNGEGGRVYFYQSEMPYDPPSQQAWSHGGAKAAEKATASDAANGIVNGYASYKVSDAVKSHEAWGLGVYAVFYAAPVVADTAIETPETPGVKMHNMITLRLGGGKPGSGIKHVVNERGEGVFPNPPGKRGTPMARVE